jgi:predicted nucleotidyltransferase
MKILSEILSSGTRAEVFRLLFDGSRTELHVREIERQSGFSDRTVRDELGKLLKLDLVIKRKAGNRVYYRANQSHPLYPEIVRIVIKTVGLVDVLRDALSHEKVALAFVFGSIASGEETGGSDVDLMIIGDITLREVSRLLAEKGAELGREISPVVMNPEEFKTRLGSKETFISRIVSGPKLFIIGKNEDVERLAR